MTQYTIFKEGLYNFPKSEYGHYLIIIKTMTQQGALKCRKESE